MTDNERSVLSIPLVERLVLLYRDAVFTRFVFELAFIVFEFELPQLFLRTLFTKARHFKVVFTLPLQMRLRIVIRHMSAPFGLSGLPVET